MRMNSINIPFKFWIMCALSAMLGSVSAQVSNEAIWHCSRSMLRSASKPTLRRNLQQPLSMERLMSPLKIWFLLILGIPFV